MIGKVGLDQGRVAFQIGNQLHQPIVSMPVGGKGDGGGEEGGLANPVLFLHGFQSVPKLLVTGDDDGEMLSCDIEGLRGGHADSALDGKVFGHLRHGEVLGVGEVGVDLIADDSKMVFGRLARQLLQLIPSEDIPGRVLRGAEDHQFGFARQCVEALPVQGEPVVLRNIAHRPGNQLPVQVAGDVHEGLVGWKRYDHAIVLSGKQLHQHADRYQHAGEGDHLARGEAGTVSPVREVAECLLDSVEVGISVDSAFGGGERRILDFLRGTEVHVRDPEGLGVRVCTILLDRVLVPFDGQCVGAVHYLVELAFHRVLLYVSIWLRGLM